MFTVLTRRMLVVFGVSAFGLAAMGGSALATYDAYGNHYQTKMIDGVGVAVAPDGSVIWSSVATEVDNPNSDLPLGPTSDDPAGPGTDS